MIWRAGLVWLVLASTASAVELTLPVSARLTVERNTAPDRATAPVSVFSDGAMQKVTVDGDVARSAWRIDAAGLTPLQVMRPLRAQLEAAGYAIALDCSAATCGGFDFRFAVETLPGPNMYVNIRSYQYVTALAGPIDAPTGIVTVLVSTTATSAYVQIIQAGATGDTGTAVATSSAPALPVPTTDDTSLIAVLLRDGHVVLPGLEFQTGTSALAQTALPALDSLAEFLADQPDIRIVLVGHTDSVGGLDPNIALSRDRAASVRQRLIEIHDVESGRVEAQGMGYLAPIASNLTAEGREANRRVEAVLLSNGEDD